MSFWDRIRRTSSGSGPMETVGPDDYPLTADDPHRDKHELIGRLFEQSREHYHCGPYSLKGTEAGDALASDTPDGTREILLALLDRAAYLNDKIDRLSKEDNPVPHRIAVTLGRHNGFLVTTQHVMGSLLRRRLPLTRTEVDRMLEWSLTIKHRHLWNAPLGGILKAAEGLSADHELSEQTRQLLKKMAGKIKQTGSGTNVHKMLDRIDALVGAAPEMPILAGEAWSDTALADLVDLSDDEKAMWIKLLTHCRVASGGKPTAKWIKQARGLVDDVGLGRFEASVLRWFPLVDKPRTQWISPRSQWEPDPNVMIIDVHGDILKGLVWICSFDENENLARVLTQLAISAYRKVPGVGPRAVKIGNACVYALGEMPGMSGVGQLALLRVRVKFGTAQKGIEKALCIAAERVGIPREELDEMAVPSYGLSDVGVRSETVGEFTAELHVTGTSSTELRWIREDGQTQKTVPAAVKRDHADDLKELKQAAKDIQKMLPAQKERLDQLALAQRTWEYSVWRERYLDHPLVGVLARRLIWEFTEGDQSTSAIYHNQVLVDVDGNAIECVDARTQVELWHPAGRSVEEIQSWREWFEQKEVTQPFKQAHREVYILTDAERRTGIYSNRYAAHILRQHQFNALCAARGWKNQLRLLVDAEYPPATLELPKWNIRAEFWVEGLGDEYGTDTNEAGTFLYLGTDQLRFYPIDSVGRWAHAGGGGYHMYGTADRDTPIPLEEVPPLVLSEVMRDVDLFVGVASVGNDPNWADGGPEGRYVDYWTGYSCGELSETSKTRKQVLERLIPKLRIAKRCSFTDRFLVVRGDIRTYRIHLGSGNVLMEPNDQYLCIVMPQSAAPNVGARVFLPFEGDERLSIILSKAFLLADDKKIKDRTITHQINVRH